MHDIVFSPFSKQQKVLNSDARTILVACGKRAGKTEVGAIKSIIWQETKPTNRSYRIDPFTGVIIAPTYDMLSRLSWKKFCTYAHPFIAEQTKVPKFIKWYDGSEIYGMSADKPERIEGIKADWIWIDEIFHCDEQIFLEAQARVSDTKGFILMTGSLGVQYINPKQHWVYRHIVQKQPKGTEFHTWATLENPFFPKDELNRLKETLDEETFKQMFTINWDSNSSHMVYRDWSVDNQKSHKYDPDLPTYVSVDWGWTHKMACIFAQYNPMTDEVYVFDEIVQSHLSLDELFLKIKERGYQITGYCCDIAGNQTREQMGISNMRFFKDKGIQFQARRTAIIYGIALIRSYVKSFTGKRRVFVDADRCPELISSLKAYKYDQDSRSSDELPIKEDDDAVDALRYLFVNFIDKDVRVRQNKTIRL